jgi:hypothetical protein
MKNIIHILPVIIIFGLVVVPASASDSDQEATNWGKSVQGVQLSIMMATNVFQVGSSTTVESVTKNSSTNDIVVDIFAPTMVFDVLLTNSAGKTYHVTTPMMIRGPRHFVTIKPGEESAESIPVTFGDIVEPGDYTLRATRHFSSSKEDYIHEVEGAFTLESNLIKVQIK